MAEQLRFKNLGKVARSIRVMGINEYETLFEGTIVDVVLYHHSSPAVLTVEGYLYDGIYVKHFSRDMPLIMLKEYNKEEFDVLENLLKEEIDATAKAERCRKQFKRLLA